jgi:hypothetical protein
MVETQTEALPDAFGSNVIAEHRGRLDGAERIIVDAHYGTRLDTPGWYDNAPGVGGLYGGLERLKQAGLRCKSVD